MTEQPESPENTGLPPTTPPAGTPPNPYSYPPGPPGSYPGNYPGAYPGGYPGQSGYPGPGGYPPPPMPYGDYYAPMAAPRNGVGVAALVVAVIALVGSCSVLGGIGLGILAVILGFIGRGRAKRGEANNGGVATTGVILGFLAIALSIAFIAFYANSFNKYGGSEMISCIQSAGSDNDKVQQCMDEFQKRVESQTGQTRGPGR